MTRTAILIGLVFGATAAYAGPERDLGATVRGNIAAQTIDPAPDYSDVPDPGTSGKRAADAVIRYQTGKLKPLLRTNGKPDIGSQGGAGDAQIVSGPLITTGPN